MNIVETKKSVINTLLPCWTITGASCFPSSVVNADTADTIAEDTWQATPKK